MERHYFTIEEAVEICDDFEDLNGTKIRTDAGEIYRIREVVVSPYDEDAKAHFLANYNSGKSADMARAFHDGPDFDVLILAKNLDEPEEYITLDIRTFAISRGVNYQFPGS